MKTKTLNKLNNVLKGLELSKEQKQMLVEVFDEIGNNSGDASGGSSNVLYIDLVQEYEQPMILKVGDIEITDNEMTEEPYGDTAIFKYIINEKLYYTLLDYYALGYNFIVKYMFSYIDYNGIRRTYYTIPCTFGKEWNSNKKRDTMVFIIDIEDVKLKFIVQYR